MFVFVHAYHTLIRSSIVSNLTINICCYSLRNSDNLTGPIPVFDSLLSSPSLLLDVSLESDECFRLLL